MLTYTVYLLKIKYRYKVTSRGSKSVKLDAIEEVRKAFDQAERVHPGVCEFFVKEVINSIADSNFGEVSQRGHSKPSKSSHSSNSNSSSTSSRSSSESTPSHFKSPTVPSPIYNKISYN